jgi:copper chaperone CopZ
MPAEPLTLLLSGLTCQGCVGRVKSRLLAHPSVTGGEVSLTQATLQVSQPVTVAEVNAWLSEIGHYTAAAIAPVATPQALPRPSLATYRPLVLILLYLLLSIGAVMIARGQWDGHLAMRLFMAGFFLVFSFFKLLGLSAFARAYAGYDLVAAAWAPYGKIYPFIELGLGLAYLAGWQLPMVNAITAGVMAVSLIGVIRAVSRGSIIQCACLGTVFQLPMSTVTIIEDALMLIMAVLMIL